MADPRGSQAYDLSLFESKKAKVTNIQPNKKQLKANHRRARLQALINAVTVLVTAAAVVGALGLMVFSHVRLTEMNNTIANLEQELAILNSETKTLTHTLAAQTSTQSIEEYAVSHGMQKLESSQIEYFTVESESQSATAEVSLTWWESLWERITHLFGATA